MATKLRGLRFDQAANLVDDPANPKARVVLTKRNTTEQDAAAAFAVVKRAARAAAPKEFPVGKQSQKSSLFKRFAAALLKAAEAEAAQKPVMADADADDAADADADDADVPAKPAAPAPDHAHDDLKGFTTKLAEAIAAYGDTSKLPENHPVHALKALHKEACEKLAAHQASKDAEAEAARKAAEADDDAEAEAALQAEGQDGPPMGAIHKRFVTLKKQVAEANERAAAAEKIAKAERNARELEATKTTLRKFRHVPIDVDKDAPVFKKLADTDKASYDAVIEKLNAAEAQAKVAKTLETALGSDLGGSNPDGAWAEIEAEAEKLVAKNEKGMTKHKAIDLVMKKRPDLVRKHYAEINGSVQ